MPADDKSRLVGDVFRSVASKYDLMNDLMSLGVHRLWKRFAVQVSDVRRGERVLDVAAGSGDLAALFAPRVGPDGRVVVSDINPVMLDVGRGRLIDRGITGNVEFVLADAENLPFPDRYFDLVTIGFGFAQRDAHRARAGLHGARAETGRAPAGAGILPAGVAAA